jgi:hypothetical protein
MKQLGVLVIAVGGLFLFFGAIVGFETGFGNLRVMNLPMVMVGGVGLLSGVILFAAGALNAANPKTVRSDRPAGSDAPYDKTKWNALLKYDDQIALVAEKLKPLGQRWVDEFASSYLALNDKSYLPQLVHKIIAAAKDEKNAKAKQVEIANTLSDDELPPLDGRQNLAFKITEKSANILRRAIAMEYEVDLFATKNFVMVCNSGVNREWYLNSNNAIEKFGKDVGIA